jgi:penicillin V acylase-like amidase (Ntn superfamily)
MHCHKRGLTVRSACHPFVAFALGALVFVPAVALACTTFCIRDGNRLVFGQNYDWYVADGVMLVNKRGVARTAYAPADRSLKWTSRHGSVTFNQYGRDQPTGGMNEAGLVVALMWVDGTGYPAPDARPAVGGGTGWIQYQLDNARTVADVIASDSHVRIPRSGSPLHYLVADRSGQVATIEFRDGKMVVHTGGTLVVPALANDFYAESVAEYKRLEGTGQLAPDRIGVQSRFARAASRAVSYRPGADPVQYVFDTLHEVAQGKLADSPAPPAHVTQWSIAYDIDSLRIHFRTRAHPAIKTVALASLDFSCVAPVVGIDVQQAAGGDVLPRLRAYTGADNLALVRSTWSQTGMLKLTPPNELERIAALPDKSVCEAARKR